MIEIISKRDGPRREDERARHLIGKNRATITRLADQLTQGGYSANKAARAAGPAQPEPEGKIIRHFGAYGPGKPDEGADLRVKVSVNNRVIAYDGDTGRQAHLLGEIRWRDGLRYFALATTLNGFLSGLPPDVLAPIEELDGQIIDEACPESLLAEEIARRLGYL
ncbi:hypothetical protein [Neomegalonema sp.]|uniref:hypothetical protein n=1 Tax=Neomegalonema sp. TaxID=2039713 RepID=UPI002637EF78|nr:hypothetical protein [Neomegalonema sp.]MDD2869988.1 hypothetical protein [Neomegalonema sp.]